MNNQIKELKGLIANHACQLYADIQESNWCECENWKKKLERLEKIEQVAEAQPKKRFCMKHPTAFWGNDQWGNPYTRCAVGHRVNEDCIEGVNNNE